MRKQQHNNTYFGTFSHFWSFGYYIVMSIYWFESAFDSLSTISYTLLKYLEIQNFGHCSKCRKHCSNYICRGSTLLQQQFSHSQYYPVCCNFPLTVRSQPEPCMHIRGKHCFSNIRSTIHRIIVTVPFNCNTTIILFCYLFEEQM